MSDQVDLSIAGACFDHEMAIWLDMTSITKSGTNTIDELHPSYIAMWPDIEAPHTPSASLMK